MKIRVLHAYYGCDTGCCGHILEIDGEEDRSSFTFSHFPERKPPGILDRIVDAVDGLNRVEVSKELKDYILEHVPEDCHASIDWNSIEVEPGGKWC